MVRGTVLMAPVPEVGTIMIGSIVNFPARSLKRSARTSKFSDVRERSFHPSSFWLTICQWCLPTFEDKFIDSVSYGLIEVLIFVFFAVEVGELKAAVAALTAAVIALVRDSTRAVKAAGTPPTSGAGAVSLPSPPAAPLGSFLCVDMVFVRRPIGVAEKSVGVLIN